MHNQDSPEYQEGVKANEGGVPRGECPYKLGSDMYRNTERECRDWLAGWDAQQEVREQWEADNHSRCKRYGGCFGGNCCLS